FLAEPTEDLEIPYQSLRGQLTQEGFRVVPEAYYPREGKPFRDAALADLKGSALFVQLLSGWTGKKLVGSTEGYVAVQHGCALEAGFSGDRLLQWRSPDLKPEKVDDPE